MDKNYDIIVIGGGHNGLTTAASLALSGKKTLLVEKNGELGGIAGGHEFHPGYSCTGLLHDTGGVRESVIKKLKLEKFGLKFQPARASVSILSKDGKAIDLPYDVDQAVIEIEKFSSNDAKAYKEYRGFINDISKFFSPLLNEIPPDLSKFGTKELLALGRKGLALKRLGKKTMMELLKVGPMSVADFLNERFETDFLKAGLAAPAIYGSYTGPWSSYTTLNLLMWECTARISVSGGPQALVNALEKAAVDAGVEIRKKSEVKKITLDKNGKVAGVGFADGTEARSTIIASSCTPHETIMNLFRPNEIEYPLEQSIKNYRSRGTTAKVHLALNQSVKFKYDTSASVSFARSGNSFDEMEKAFDAVKYRKFSDHPILDIHVPSNEQPELAPEGHSVISMLVHFAPHHFDAGWNKQQKERLLENVVNTLFEYLDNKKEDIVGSEILSPEDLEMKYGLTNGHIFHGEHAIDQLITRPIPSCARYATPIPGLYFCGSGAHPGGGITCAPGTLAAEMILKNL